LPESLDQADISPAGTFVPKYNEWHMKCMRCPDKVVVEFSFEVLLTDILPKSFHTSKKHLQQKNGASMTTCPSCQSQHAGGVDTYARSAEISDGFHFHKSCLASFEATTTFGQEIPLIQSGSRVLYYNSVAAMVSVKSKDPKATIKIYTPQPSPISGKLPLF
jgi:hypothetical protein